MTAEEKHNHPTDAGPHRKQEQPGQAMKKDNALGSRIRPAGPTAMDMPPDTWGKTDEDVDQSFPASDPPGNY